MWQKLVYYISNDFQNQFLDVDWTNYVKKKIQQFLASLNYVLKKWKGEVDKLDCDSLAVLRPQ